MFGDFIMRYFFNNHKECKEIFLYTVGYEKTQVSHQYGPTIRSGYMLHYVHSGKGIFYCQGQTYQLKAGDFFFIEPNSLIKYQADKQHPWIYYWIGFRGVLVEEYLKRTTINKYNPIFSIDNGGRIIKDKMSEILEISFIEEDNDLLLNARLFEILYYLSLNYPLEKIHQDKNKQNTLLTKAIQLMRNNINLNLQIQEIAQILSIDRTYLHRIFKENIGTSPKQYLINLKMTRAKELLINTDSPLNVISLSVGIDDVANFSKLFKKNENMSPKQYRQKYQLQKKHK